MAEKELSQSDALALSGANDPDFDTGVRFPEDGADPWAVPFYRFGHQLAKLTQLANQCRVYRDDANDTTIGVRAGRAVIAGSVLDYSGETIDLSSYNNDTALVWLEDDGGPTIKHDTQSNGWPSGDHIKLAEVTVSSGEIGLDDIVDRRPEAMLSDAADQIDAHQSATSVHGISGDVVGTTDQQTLSNKTLGLERVSSSGDHTTTGESVVGVTDTSAARTVTLASADATDGRVVIVKDESGGAGTNNITVATEGSETIDGASSQTISTNYGVLRLYSDGSNWFTL
jgi:hypothetical protein